jgi:hypothetical protein
MTVITVKRKEDKDKDDESKKEVTVNVNLWNLAFAAFVVGGIITYYKKR